MGELQHKQSVELVPNSQVETVAVLPAPPVQSGQNRE